MEVTLVGNGCRQEKPASFCASSSPAPYPILQALGHTAAADINFNFLITIPNITLYSYQGFDQKRFDRRGNLGSAKTRGWCHWINERNSAC